MSKYKVGDQVVSVSDTSEDIKIGGIYTVIEPACAVVIFRDDGGTRRVRLEYLYAKIKDSPALSASDAALDYLKARITDLRSREGNNRAEIDELCRMLTAVYGLQIVTKLGIEFQPVES